MGKKPSVGNSGNEELHEAARLGDLKAVQAICSANPLAVNSRDRHSRTPYFTIDAALVIFCFLKQRSNHRLHLAAWSGHSDVVNYLCKNKADVGAAAMDDMGAIHFAAQKGHLEVIKTLVASGVSVKSTNRKVMTALHYAAQGSNIQLVNYLLKKGANKDVKNKAGKSAVDLASSEEIRKLLVEYESEKGDKAEKGSASVEGSDSNAALQGEEDDSLKRKNEDEENQQEAKKTKVALGHLLAEDDMPEEEEDN